MKPTATIILCAMLWLPQVQGQGSYGPFNKVNNGNLFLHDDKTMSITPRTNSPFTVPQKISDGEINAIPEGEKVWGGWTYEVTWEFDDHDTGDDIAHTFTDINDTEQSSDRVTQYLGDKYREAVIPIVQSKTGNEYKNLGYYTINVRCQIESVNIRYEKQEDDLIAIEFNRAGNPKVKLINLICSEVIKGKGNVMQSHSSHRESKNITGRHNHLIIKNSDVSDITSSFEVSAPYSKSESARFRAEPYMINSFFGAGRIMDIVIKNNTASVYYFDQTLKDHMAHARENEYSSDPRGDPSEDGLLANNINAGFPNFYDYRNEPGPDAPVGAFWLGIMGGLFEMGSDLVTNDTSSWKYIYLNGEDPGTDPGPDWDNVPYPEPGDSDWLTSSDWYGEWIDSSFEVTSTWMATGFVTAGDSYVVHSNSSNNTYPVDSEGILGDLKAYWSTPVNYDYEKEEYFLGARGDFNFAHLERLEIIWWVYKPYLIETPDGDWVYNDGAHRQKWDMPMKPLIFHNTINPIIRVELGWDPLSMDVDIWQPKYRFYPVAERSTHEQPDLVRFTPSGTTFESVFDVAESVEVTDGPWDLQEDDFDGQLDLTMHPQLPDDQRVYNSTSSDRSTTSFSSSRPRLTFRNRSVVNDHPLDEFGNVVVMGNLGWDGATASEDKSSFTPASGNGFITDTRDYLAAYIYQKFWPTFAPLTGYPKTGTAVTVDGEGMIPIYTHPDQDSNAPAPTSF